MNRRGMGKGRGKGYRNIIGKDPMVHSQSAKGIKQPQKYTLRPTKFLVPPPAGSEVLFGADKQIVKTTKDLDRFNRLYRKGYNLKTISKKMGIGSNYALELFYKKDSDGDGVPDNKDCAPHDPTRQDKKIVQSNINPTKTQNRIIEVLDNWMQRYMKETDWKDAFDDVRIYTNKEMTCEHNDDPSRGWTGTMCGLKQKSKDSNVVLCVTYDGAGADILNDFTTQNKIQQQIDNKFGRGKYTIEPYTTWAFQIYKTG